MMNTDHKKKRPFTRTRWNAPIPSNPPGLYVGTRWLPRHSIFAQKKKSQGWECHQASFWLSCLGLAEVAYVFCIPVTPLMLLIFSLNSSYSRRGWGFAASVEPDRVSQPHNYGKKSMLCTSIQEELRWWHVIGQRGETVVCWWLVETRSSVLTWWIRKTWGILRSIVAHHSLTRLFCRA